ncbi:MAG: hypothetical protein MUC48_03120 [Leptolyngbya sp. Prado105]|jgi:hypothetical protein|nr:hypothetical protein [Leptolyngbya sp. Prado105]
MKNLMIFFSIVVCWIIFGLTSLPLKNNMLELIRNAGICGGVTGALWYRAYPLNRGSIKWDQMGLFTIIGVVVGMVIWWILEPFGSVFGGELAGLGFGIALVVLLMLDLTQYRQKRY